MLREKKDPIFHLPKHAQNELIFWKKCRKNQIPNDTQKGGLAFASLWIKKNQQIKEPLLTQAKRK